MKMYVAQEAAPAAATGAPRAEGLDLDLADAACAWVTDTVLLMALADGSLTMLTLHVENGTVRRMKVGARWDTLVSHLLCACFRRCVGWACARWRCGAVSKGGGWLLG